MGHSDRRLIPAALLLLPGGFAVYAAGRQGGAAAALLAAVAVVLCAVLVLMATVGPNLEERQRIRGLADSAMALLPGALVVVTGFSGGSFQPGTTALITIVLAVLLAMRVALADAPFAGITPWVGIAAGGLALYAGWNLLSGSWSDAHWRALTEFDRALMYALAVLLMGSIVRTPERTRHMVWGLAFGISIVCGAGFVSRVAPDVLSTTAIIANNRLSYPVGYWNALGLLAAMGALLTFHLTCSEREPVAARVLGAAAVPALAVTVLLTFSRGAILAGSLGLVVYVVAARPRALVQGLVAALPAATIAVVVAYNADELATEQPTSSLAVSQGHNLALVVALCMFGAAVLRWLSLPIDAPVARIRIPRAFRVAVLACALTVALVIALVLDAPGALSHEYDRVVHTRMTQRTGDVRDRLTDPGNSGRIDFWRAARDAFRDEPVRGIGAASYATYWTRHRQITQKNDEPHSIYLEALAELGLVGGLLLGVALAAILVGLVLRVRGPDRAAYGAVLAGTVAWGAHAAIDWDWEMPVVTLWVLAASGAALAAAEGARRTRPHTLIRVAVMAGLLGLAVPAALVAFSQADLNDAVASYDRGACRGASSDARSAASVVGNRPDPYEVLGYCAARERRKQVGQARMEQAIARDPDNWEYRYGLAVVRASVGLDPTRQLAAARRLNPREPLVKRLSRRLNVRNRHVRTSRARRAIPKRIFNR